MSTNEKPLCKGCSGSVRVSESEIKRLLDELQESDVELAPEDVYQARLNTCKSCTDLQFSTTCRHCGCLVALRAWIKDKHCPHPSEPRW